MLALEVRKGASRVVTGGGCERTERALAELLSKAGLRLTRVVPLAVAVSVANAVRA